MTPVVVEKLLMFVEQGVTQSVDDPFPILLPNPKGPEGFKPLLFSDRPLSYDLRDDFYFPSSFCHQGPKTRSDGGVPFIRHPPHVLEVVLPTIDRPLEFKKNNVLRFPVYHQTV